MHITTLFTITFSLVITCVFGAPVHADSWLVTRTVTVNPISILASTHQNSNVSPHLPTRNMGPSQARVGLSTSNNAARFEKLKLSAAQFPANHKAIPINGRGTCLGSAIGMTSSTICHSGSENPGRTRNAIYLHPDGKGGPDTNTVKVTLGDKIGAGMFGSVHEVDYHELDHHGPLVVKQFFNPHSEDTAKEVSNLRQVGQLHASGMYNGRIYAVIPKAKGVHLIRTNSYFVASLKGNKALAAMKNQAGTKASEAVLEAAKEHGLVHNDVHHGNVRFEEDDKGNLTKAHLIDWGVAYPAPKGEGPNGEFTKEQEDQIKHMSMSQFINGKRR